MSAFAPSGWFTLTAFVLIFVAAAVVLARCRAVVVKVLAAVLAFLVAALAGVAAVNGYYGYYTTWSALGQDLQADNGASALPVRIPIASPSGTASPGSPHREPPTAGSGDPWTLHTLPLPGPTSGVSGRTGLVVLPPASISHGPLPVLVLLHGDPGEPSSWTSGLHIATVLREEAALGRIGPMAVVLPDVHGGFRDQQCLDASSGPRLATYLRVDVPRDIAAALPVTAPGPTWTVGGLSDGAFCAADTGLKAPESFGSIAVMDGTFRPDLTSSVVSRVYGGRKASAAQDDLATLVQSRSSLPRFWVMAGNGNARDYREAVAFATVVGLRQDLRFVTAKGGTHTTPAWRAALPDLLRWAWASSQGRSYGGSIEIALR